MELPKLYHKGKQGAVYEWRIWTEGADIVTEYGQAGGQKVIARRTAEAKNVGRANETSAEAQAMSEANSDWKHKLDRKYVDSLERVNQRKIDVMKAPTKQFADTKKYVRYPADVQPKLDGARCLAYWENGRVVLLSRGRKEWNLPHIKEQLAKILPEDAMFDGELYLHGVKRQTIQSWITKHYPQTLQIGLHIYDIPICDGEEKPWSERREDLNRLVPMADMFKPHPDTPNIHRVVTMEVSTEEEIMRYQMMFLEAKFEGAMVRNRHGRYDWGNRSTDLLKVKTFDDDEFEVIGFKDGTGKNVGIVTWKCKTKDGKEFDCDPIGTYEERAMWFKNGHKYIGEKLTVKFQGYSDDGIPQFVKGVAFRLKEDQDVLPPSKGRGDLED